MAIISEIRRRLPILTTEQKQSPDETAVVHQIDLRDIIPNRSQPRSSFNQNAILRLADSIKQYGILQPLTVRKVLLPADPGGQAAESRQNRAIYELVAGERRLRAAKIAQLDTAPCIIINTDDATSAELALIENLLREDLNMFEQAEAFQKLISDFHLTQEEAARRVSMSQSAVANKMRLLKLTEEQKNRILDSGLTERHARALLKISDDALRDRVLDHIIASKLNVSTSEAYIENVLHEMARFHSKKVIETVSDVRFEENSDLASGEPALSDAFAEDCFPEPIRQVVSQRRARFKGSIKDMQLFYNSVRNAMQLLDNVGLYSQMQRAEDENGVVLTITIRRASDL